MADGGEGSKDLAAEEWIVVVGFHYIHPKAHKVGQPLCDSLERSCSGGVDRMGVFRSAFLFFLCETQHLPICSVYPDPAPPPPPSYTHLSPPPSTTHLSPFPRPVSSPRNSSHACIQTRIQSCTGCTTAASLKLLPAPRTLQARSLYIVLFIGFHTPG